MSHGLLQTAVLRRLLIQYYLTSIISTPVRGTGATAGDPDRSDSLYHRNGHISQCNQCMKRQLKLLSVSQNGRISHYNECMERQQLKRGDLLSWSSFKMYPRCCKKRNKPTIQYNTMHWFSEENDGGVVDDGRWDTHTHTQRELELHHLPLASLLANSSPTSCSPRSSTVVDWQAIGIGKFGNFSAIYAQLLCDSNS